MKKVNKFLTLFSIVFFSSNSFAAKKTPDWVNNVDKECSKNEICAIGNGDTMNMARTDARNNILKYFETSVNARFKSSLSTDEKTIDSSKSEDLEEVSNGILKGVKIKTTYGEGSDYYALATLNKDVAIKEIKSDIDKADNKMKLLLAENNIKYNRQLEKLYNQRDALNKRYLVLTGNMVPEVVKYEDIFKVKKTSGELSLKYYIENTSDNFSHSIASYLSSILVENGAKIANAEKNANRIVQVTINKTNLHLNIEGFIKQMYSLQIDIYTTSGNVVSSIYEEFTETGRSEAQIKESISSKIKDYINENIELLLQ